ncbi:hypothetical protein QEH42_gp279 [Microbacterium phage Pumpernickel]|uniref:Uncharacterized protein n=1 Tax=Microbacterium phage Pumpernickel TaxID=2885983 RepID=A0AAE8Y766_9CAUD|nr:hypothetical protein QEH42_gp279 [Microbacterium phage Pumpernickel]UDL15939.1 hypothetical protein SEA_PUMPERNICKEL_189 [Microbacterium phage Pumpernickel]
MYSGLMNNELWGHLLDRTLHRGENYDYVHYSAADVMAMLTAFEVATPKKEPAVRQKDELGRQLFIVNDKYSYAWDGDEPILVGDRVKLPGEHGAWYGEVTDLGSPYTGYMRVVTEKAEPKR